MSSASSIETDSGATAVVRASSRVSIDGDGRSGARGKADDRIADVERARR